MHTALVCDKDSRIRGNIEEALHTLGLHAVFACNQRDNALELAFDHQPDLIVLEAAPPVSGLDLAITIRKKIPALAILVLKQGDESLLKQATTAQIDAFLYKPLQQPDLLFTLELTIHTARQVATLRAELITTQTALSQRKVIEKAKGLLMERERISEDAAFRMMRGQSMARRINMATLADELLTKNVRQDLP
jgi:two-component system, response regulator PdtaR